MGAPRYGHGAGVMHMIDQVLRIFGRGHDVIRPADRQKWGINIAQPVHNIKFIAGPQIVQHCCQTIFLHAAGDDLRQFRIDKVQTGFSERPSKCDTRRKEMSHTPAAKHYRNDDTLPQL